MKEPPDRADWRGDVRPALGPLAALGAVLAITAAWWTLALWPAGEAVPAWVAQTRAVCFGAAPGGLPDGAGWAALVGQPLVMLGILGIGWGRELGSAFREFWRRPAGRRVLLGAAVALPAVATGSAALAVGPGIDREPRPVATAVVRDDAPAPPLLLTDQTGATFDLRTLRGRPVLVAFAYAHCETVCPSLVQEVATARRRLAAGGHEAAAVVVTLDPWRDTPARLPAIAGRWPLDDGVRLLSGSVERVEATLDAWRVPRRRDPRTGELVHPRVVYVVDPDGRLAYVSSGGIDELAVLATRTLEAEG